MDLGEDEGDKRTGSRGVGIAEGLVEYIEIG